MRPKKCLGKLNGGKMRIYYVRTHKQRTTGSNFWNMNREEIISYIHSLVETGETCASFFNKAIEELPPEIGLLKDVEELDLSDNKLTSLPPEITQLSKLRILNIEYNELTDLPAELGQLTALEELYLGHNELSELPASLSQLKHLRKLYLPSNLVSVLPSKLDTLIHLEDLDISDNGIVELPADFGKLRRLIQLNISDNKLRFLPLSFRRLSQLKTFAGGDNSFEIFPSPLFHLPQLVTIDLGNNAIAHLPTHVDEWSELLYLNLRNNSLSELPHSLGKLCNLARLNVSYNQLKSLPASLVDLTGLKELSLDGNHFEEPLSYLVNKGIYALMNYLMFDHDSIKGEQLQFIFLPLQASDRFLLQQYLCGFEEYASLAKSKTLRLEVVSKKNGLQLMLFFEGAMDKEEILDLLEEYLLYLKEGNGSKLQLRTLDSGQKDAEKMLLITNEMRLQVTHFNRLRRNRNIEKKLFDQRLDEVIQKLRPQSEVTRPVDEAPNPGPAS